MSINDAQVRLCVIYRPPPSKQNGFRNSVFFDEWSVFLDQLTVTPHDVIITGDMNFHLDNPGDPDTRLFMGMLESHGLVQHVNVPTHIHGHTLDVLITRDDCSVLSGTPSVLDPSLIDTGGNPSGDHLAIHTMLNIAKPASIRKEITFRKLRAISVPDFIKDIETSPCLQHTNGSVADLVEAYNTGISALIDKHAPQQVKSITLRPGAPWYTDELRTAKRKRRKAERLWRKTKLTIHQQLFKEECRTVSALLAQSKKDYYSNKIAECGTDHKQLFQLTKNLMGHKREVVLPSCSSDEKLLCE